MSNKLNIVVKEIKNLGLIKDDKLVLDLIYEDGDNLQGVSVKDLGLEDSKELFWVEILEDNGLDVSIHPDIDTVAKDTQEVWAVLYCLAAVMKKEDEHIWEGSDVSEIAETIYDSRRTELDVIEEEVKETLLETLEKGKVNTDKELVDMPDEIDITIDTELLTEIVLSYNSEEAETVVGFINTIAKISGVDFKMDLVDDEGELQEVEETNYAKAIGSLKEEVMGEMGILEPKMVINNLTAMINHELATTKELDRDKLTFINELINERIKIEIMVDELFGGDE